MVSSWCRKGSRVHQAKHICDFYGKIRQEVQHQLSEAIYYTVRRVLQHGVHACGWRRTLPSRGQGMRNVAADFSASVTESKRAHCTVVSPRSNDRGQDIDRMMSR